MKTNHYVSDSQYRQLAGQLTRLLSRISATRKLDVTKMPPGESPAMHVYRLLALVQAMAATERVRVTADAGVDAERMDNLLLGAHQITTSGGDHDITPDTAMMHVGFAQALVLPAAESDPDGVGSVMFKALSAVHYLLLGVALSGADLPDGVPFVRTDGEPDVVPPLRTLKAMARERLNHAARLINEL